MYTHVHNISQKFLTACYVTELMHFQCCACVCTCMLRYTRHISCIQNSINLVHVTLRWWYILNV